MLNNTSLIKYQKPIKMNRPICEINHYLDAFKPLLASLGTDNMVLAGVNALKLHGLFMSRSANDLDVVLFQPTKDQLIKLSDLAIFQVQNPFGHTGNYSVEDQTMLFETRKQKVIKFKRFDFLCDIILSDDPIPDNLLYHKAFDIMWKIQNIALNIEAKNSYKTQERSGLALYRRSKDMEDMIDLKNSNFNF